MSLTLNNMIRYTGRKRPLQQHPFRFASFSSSTAQKPPHLDRLKVNVHHQARTNQLSPFLLLVPVAGAYSLYRSVEIIPTGFVGVDKQHQDEVTLIPAGLHWRAPWKPRVPKYSTQQQSLAIRTRVFDSKSIKVFVSVLVQYQLELKNIPVYLEQQKQKQQKQTKVSLWQDPQLYWEQTLQKDPTSQLQSLLTRQIKSTIEQVLEKETAIDAHFGVRNSSVVDVGDKLQKHLQKDSGLTIHRVSVTDLEFPHWVEENIQDQMYKSWTMEKFVQQRHAKRRQQQKEGVERLEQYAKDQIWLSELQEEEEAGGQNDSHDNDNGSGGGDTQEA